ncbi:hypothetical protein CBM2633_A50671 [Cupriavidus taiwanensis]|nr:hypothetical protein CBM2633_A50671 [Cupriavidus taiwanensis]
MRSRSPQRKQMLVGLTSMKHLKPILAVGGFVQLKNCGPGPRVNSIPPRHSPVPRRQRSRR